jgi:hypothetical protein
VSPETKDWESLPVGQWFFHDSPECVQRYCVAERTSSGWRVIATASWVTEVDKRNMQAIAEMHNRSLADIEKEEK